MSDNDPEALVAFRDLVGDARTGSLSVALNPAEFAALEEACDSFKTAISDIQANMRQAGSAGVGWGLGENNSRLRSAVNLVAKYRDLATGEGNSLISVLEEHYAVAEEIRTLFGVIRDDYIRTDEEFAAKWRQLNTELETGPR